MSLFDDLESAEATQGAVPPEGTVEVELSFEEAFRQLEETVRRLEEGDLKIDELVALYERGVQLTRVCNARLDAAELRVSQLVSGSEGEAELTPFED